VADLHQKIAQRAVEARYSFAEAARLIGRQAGTLRRWALGHDRLYAASRGTILP
jgi:transposase-like protein